MDEQTKTMIDDLNKVLGTNYNIISFSELGNDALLQILVDVLNTMQSDSKLSFQQGIDVLMTRIPEILHNIGYKCDRDVDPEYNKDDFKRGEKKIIYPILHWLFQNYQKAKLRAYLAEYLVRINIPPSHLQNPEIQAAYKQYLGLIESFKQAHSEWERTKEDSAIAKVTEEKIEVLTKNTMFLTSRISDAQEKINKFPNVQDTLPMINTLWLEHHKEAQMTQQMDEQNKAIAGIDITLNNLQNELENIQAARASSGDPVKRVQAEVAEMETVLSQLPKQVDEMQKKVDILRQVVNTSNVSEDDLNDWRGRIDDLQNEVRELEEKKKLHLGPLADKLAPYRKELLAITETQNRVKETINRSRREFQRMDKNMKEKQTQVDKIIGHEVKRGTELKDYIRNLRQKNAVVDAYREIIAAMKTEHEIQLRTMEILGQKHPDVKQIFDKHKQGGVTSAAPFAAPSTNSVTEMVRLCKQKRMEVDSAKAQLSAFMQEVLPLRETVVEEKDKLLQRQKTFDTQVGGLKQQLDQGKRELDNMQNDLKRKEEQWKMLQREIENKEETLQRISAETTDAVGSVTQKEVLEQKLQEIQEETNQVIAKKEDLERTQSEREAICKSWLTIKKLLEIKIRNREASQKSVHKIGRVEVMTL